MPNSRRDTTEASIKVLHLHSALQLWGNGCRMQVRWWIDVIPEAKDGVYDRAALLIRTSQQGQVQNTNHRSCFVGRKCVKTNHYEWSIVGAQIIFSRETVCLVLSSLFIFQEAATGVHSMLEDKWIRAPVTKNPSLIQADGFTMRHFDSNNRGRRS